MHQRAFLLLFGSVAPLALLGGAVGGCGSVITVADGGGGSGAHGAGAHGTGGSGAGGALADASIDYHDPGCPDAGPPLTQFDCDPYHQGNGDCPPGEGCYIFSSPPQTVCGQETYGATCGPQGAGTQGDPCGGAQSCAAGFACVITGAGTQCVLLCELQGATGCPNGLVCQPIDVQGFGGCL